MSPVCVSTSRQHCTRVADFEAAFCASSNSITVRPFRSAARSVAVGFRRHTRSGGGDPPAIGGAHEMRLGMGERAAPGLALPPDSPEKEMGEPGETGEVGDAGAKGSSFSFESKLASFAVSVSTGRTDGFSPEVATATSKSVGETSPSASAAVPGLSSKVSRLDCDSSTGGGPMARGAGSVSLDDARMMRTFGAACSTRTAALRPVSLASQTRARASGPFQL